MSEEVSKEARKVMATEIDHAIQMVRRAARMLPHVELDSPASLAVQGLLATAAGSLIQAQDVMAKPAAKTRGETR
jgi:hypothetical protein